MKEKNRKAGELSAALSFPISLYPLVLSFFISSFQLGFVPPKAMAQGSSETVPDPRTSVIEFKGSNLESLCFDNCEERSDTDSFEKMVRIVERLEASTSPTESGEAGPESAERTEQ